PAPVAVTAAVQAPPSAPAEPAGTAAYDAEAARRAGSMSYGGITLAQVSSQRRSADN
ncbi:MAG: hypothetical protein HQL40_18875, partial [Alphaproteobacteria bacterium]|nr:hypothetical protein [Alphaproteobacteria bacterium]